MRACGILLFGLDCVAITHRISGGTKMFTPAHRATILSLLKAKKSEIIALTCVSHYYKLLQEAVLLLLLLQAVLLLLLIQMTSD